MQLLANIPVHMTRWRLPSKTLHKMDDKGALLHFSWEVLQNASKTIWGAGEGGGWMECGGVDTLLGSRAGVTRVNEMFNPHFWYP